MEITIDDNWKGVVEAQTEQEALMLFKKRVLDYVDRVFVKNGTKGEGYYRFDVSQDAEFLEFYTEEDRARDWEMK